MNIHRITAGVQVRRDFAACYDFYTQQLGLLPVYGDRNGPYTNFAATEGGEPFFALYAAEHAASRVPKYAIPTNTASSDTLTAVFHTIDFAGTYARMQQAGVQFIGKRNFADEGFDFNMALFRDPEGNLLSLEDGGV